jgi:hypothetical protein
VCNNKAGHLPPDTGEAATGERAALIRAGVLLPEAVRGEFPSGCVTMVQVKLPFSTGCGGRRVLLPCPDCAQASPPSHGLIRFKHEVRISFNSGKTWP